MDLPVELLAYIAVMDYGRCYREMLAIPVFGRFAIKNRKWLYQQMTMKIRVNVFKGKPTIYLLFGKIHRDDAPAIIYNDVSMPKDVIYQFHQYGELHRENGPAVECLDGIKIWLKRGKIHRDESQPCTTYPTGIGPAVECPDGRKEWLQYNKLHREDGPAVICELGEFWFRWGKFHRGKSKKCPRYPNGDGPAVIYRKGSIEWWHNGKFHRDKGPAKILHHSGYEEYYKRGKFIKWNHIPVKKIENI